MAVPIWRDYRVNLSTADSAIYRICRNSVDNVVYFGKAWKRPGYTDVVITLNDIAADYFAQVTPRLPDDFDTAGFAVTPLEAVTLIVQVQQDDASFTTIDEVIFVNDWSYNFKQSGVISEPIRNTWDRRMPYVLTMPTADILKLQVYEQGIVIKTVSFDPTTQLAKDFNADFNGDFATADTLPLNSVISVDLSRYALAERVVFTFGDTVTDVTLVDTCNNFVLYYLNSYGGWDGYIIDGALAPSFDVDRGIYNRDYTNDDPANSGIINYRNDITRKAQVRTGWLTNEESRRMATNLFASPIVYLYNRAAEVLTPVHLTGTQYDVKTYDLNGGALVNYAVDIEVSRSYVRR